MRIEEPDRVRNYVHRCVDRSLTQNFLRRWVTLPVHRFVPPDISPDLITLAGFAGVLVSTAALFQMPLELRQDPLVGGATMVATAFLLLFYAVADQLDGLQAARQSRGSPLGDFVDHWCDAVAAVLLIGSLGWWFALPSWSILIILVAAIICFWLNNWDAYHNGCRLLPDVGGLEGVEISIVLLIAGAHFGPDFLQAEVLGIEMHRLLFAFFFLSFLQVIVPYLYRTRSGRREVVAFAVGLAPWIACWAIAPDEPLAYVTIGLVGVKLIANQQQRHLLGAAAPTIDGPMTLAGLALLVASVFDGPDGPVGSACARLVTVGVAIVVLAQAARTRRFILRALPETTVGVPSD